MRSVKGRGAIVTGATGGIGACVVRRLSAAGVRLVISGTDRARLDQLAGDVPDSHAVVADLADQAQLRALADRARAQLGRVDVLVHVAGLDSIAAFDELSAEEFDAQLAVDLAAPLRLTQYLLPDMLTRGCGHVVFVGSLSAVLGGAFQVPYAASKAGLDAATRALRAEYRGSGVGFSVVHPAPVAGAGRYARRVAEHGRVPRLVGETTPDRVAQAVERAIVHDLAVVLVASRPVRPLLALRGLAPRCADALVDATGITGYFRRIAGR